MKKVTKAIKIVSGLTDEEKQEFAEFFKLEDEEQKEEVEKKEIEQKETKKEESKEDKKGVDFEAKFNELQQSFETVVNEVKTLKETAEKQKGFGAKQKQGDGKETNDFNTLFEKLNQKQF